MNVYDAIMNRRTIRKFTQEQVSEQALIRLVDCARMAAYGANMQPLKFAVVMGGSERDALFDACKWAGYLTDGAPAEGERPTAYITVLGDTNIRKNGAFETDAGAAVTNMMLAAEEEGLATCWLGAIDRDSIKKTLDLPGNLNVLYLLAVGKPAQKSRPTDMKDGDVKYYLDDTGVLNVPKRSINEILTKIVK